MVSSITLTKEFLTHFNISGYSTPKKGGQKTVFYVTIDSQTYALKIINVNDDRFKRELRICTEFKEMGGIPKIIRVEEFEKETVIIEEYIDGDDLSDIYTTYHDDEEKVCDLIRKIWEILTPIWEHNYVHRDIKPQNIRIKKNGNPIILDFGIARALDEASITLTGNQPLTYLFGSPEQYGGNKKLISYRTDFFCIGIIAYYLFTGKLPFGNDSKEISSSFSANKTKVSMTSKKLEAFCNAVFKVSPSERPRNPESLLNYL